MVNWGRIIEEKIREARESGAFDDLPGQGLPLSLEENPHAEKEWQLAWTLLKSNGFTLPWLETRRQLEEDVAEARTALARAWARYTARQAESASALAKTEWVEARDAFRERCEALNRRIFLYNLEAPNLRFHRLPLDPEHDLAQLAGEPDTA